MIRPNLWFDSQAEEAAQFYTGIFRNSRILGRTHYSEVGREFHGREPGSVMTVTFELNGQPFLALNGGPVFTFSEAISFEIPCEDQAELDHYWDRLSEGGDPAAQQCGWLKDRFGVSWQVVPRQWEAMLNDPDPEKVARVTAAMFSMKKLDVAALERAFNG
ncbi:MAG: VOC family protein [Dehalococcoidia bacterium]|nr:VOC family protein [Dehalococcoidia bacterium]